MRKIGVLAVASVLAAALSLQGVPARAGQQAQQDQAGEQKQQEQKDQAQHKREQQESQLSKGLKPGTAKASDVIGKTVQNPQGENLGKIEDVLVDPKDGKAAFVVFDATTGFFQNLFRGRDHYLILPWEQVSYADGKFTTNVNKQQLVQVPSFASDAWPAMDSQYRERVKEYYQQARGQPQPHAQPPSPQPEASPAGQPSSPQTASPAPEASAQSSQQTTSTMPSGQAPPTPSSGDAAPQPEAAPSATGPSATDPGSAQGQTQAGSSAQPGATAAQPSASATGQSSSASSQPPGGSRQGESRRYGKDAVLVGDLIRSSQLIGKEVRNRQNEQMGKIDDLVLDLRSGQVAYTVLAQGGVLGIGEKLFAIPLQAFSAPEGGDTIILTADKEQVAKAPGFDKDNWPTTANPYWSQKSGS